MHSIIRTRKASQINEDAALFSSQLAVVMDGATSITGRRVLVDNSVHSDASWFVGEVLQHIFSNDVESSDVLQVLNNACVSANDKGNLVWSDWTSGDKPSSSFSAVRIGLDFCELYNLGDCKILIETKSSPSSISTFGSCDVDRLDRELLKSFIQLTQDAGMSRDAAWKELVPQIRRNRSSMNLPEGYWILDPSGAGIPHIQKVKIKIEDCKTILVCTDGFYRLVDTYFSVSDAELVESCRTEAGADAMLALLNTIEENDLECHRFPRIKVRDDATFCCLAWE